MESKDQNQNAENVTIVGVLKSKTESIPGGEMNLQAVASDNSSFGNKLLISLPILSFIISIVFVLSSYFYAYNRKGLKFLDEKQNVAFISDLGNEKPESSLFTFGLILATFCTLAIIVVRYFQVKHFYVKYDGLFNTVTLVTGLVFVIGKVMTLSFQLSSQRNVHFVGAGSYVIFATIYCVLQTLITLKNRTFYETLKLPICLLRVFLAAGMAVGMLIFMIFLHPDLHKYNQSGKSVGQGAEWFFAACKMLFMLTFVTDFWHLHPRVLLIKPNKQMLNDLVLSNMSRDDDPESSVSKEADVTRNGIVPLSEDIDDGGLVMKNPATSSTREQEFSNGSRLVHLTIPEE